VHDLAVFLLNVLYLIHFLYLMIIPARLRWLWLTLGVVFLDRAAKAWIESRPEDYFPHPLITNSVNLVCARNPGMAFSFWAGYSSSLVRVLLIAGTLIIIGFIAWLFVASRSGGALQAAGLALLLGGATGNVTDRILHGPVTDFLEVWLRFIPLHIFHPWPAFNVADSAVTVGAILIALDLLSPRPATKS
jgi:signal peptidase II